MGIFDWLFGKKKKDYGGYRHKDKPQNGFGKLTFGTGITYEGNWKDGLKHGEGKEIDSSGDIINEGVWEKGELLDPNQKFN